MISPVTLAAVLTVLFAVAMPSARAEVYACIAGDGTRYMSNRQNDDCYALVVGAGAGQASARPAVRGAKLTSSRAPRVSPVTLNLRAANAATNAINAVKPLRPPSPLPNVRTTWQRASAYGALIAEAAQAYGVDPYLLTAVISVESGFNPLAVSPKGAVGLMQLIPATGMRYGVAGDNGGSVAQKLADPAANIQAGARYLSDLLRRYPGNLKLVLAAYNAGEGAVQKYNEQIPPYEETRAYVVRVLGHYQQLVDLPQGSGRHEIQ
ncbi:lytic transglycosylase domain-containing protein [Paraburkholderia hayleyella]|uniref:lytic transglycosylase domain-containing protein n=1 Tax=Paraburkholderia hayleyella TaxID=2152889 RepID=UPI001FE98F8A|nr:lytic transglycosylase domain-containing protein [Paraburkholderia hayleyella]